MAHWMTVSVSMVQFERPNFCIGQVKSGVDEEGEESETLRRGNPKEKRTLMKLLVQCLELCRKSDCRFTERKRVRGAISSNSLSPE